MLLLFPSPFCRDCESLCNSTKVLLKYHKKDARQVQIILVTTIWLETLPTPTFAETEKQQKLSHMADPWTTACCSVKDESLYDEEIQPLPQHHYFVRTHLVTMELDNNHPLPSSTVIPTHAIRDRGGHTWFSSCTSMLYWGPGWTSVTFSPRRKPRRVMSVFAASSTDGGGPSSCSVSPKQKKTRFRQELFTLAAAQRLYQRNTATCSCCTLSIRVFRLFMLFKPVLPFYAGH